MNVSIFLSKNKKGLKNFRLSFAILVMLYHYIILPVKTPTSLKLLSIQNYIELAMSLDDELSKRIKYVVSLAKEIPFYVKKAEEVGIDLDRIRTPQDLLKAYEKGLYTTPEDLYDKSVVCHKHPQAKGPFYSSGMKGKPKEVWVNPDDKKRFISQCAKIYEVALEKDYKVLNCFPRIPAISGYGLSTALDSLGYSFIHFPAQKIGDDIKKFVKKLKEFKPTAIMGLTTLVYRLPLILDLLNIDTCNLGVKSIITAGEPSTVERRKTIGNEFGGANVYDFYGTTENDVIAYESEPFSDKQVITLPETLVFLCEKNGNPVSEGEIGNVTVTNLYEVGSKPWSVLLNYKIGDWAKCLEKDNDIITLISGIRREAAYLAGAKLDPTELEKIIEDLRVEGVSLTGEYAVINYYDKERRAVAEVRMEIAENLTLQEREEVERKIKEKIYESNIPVRTMVEEAKDAKLIIKLTAPGKLYQGYEHLIKPGKPRRLLTIQ